MSTILDILHHISKQVYAQRSSVKKDTTFLLKIRDSAQAPKREPFIWQTFF